MVEGFLDLSEIHAGDGVVDVAVVGWEVECGDDGGAELVVFG